MQWDQNTTTTSNPMRIRNVGLPSLKMMAAQRATWLIHGPEMVSVPVVLPMCAFKRCNYELRVGRIPVSPLLHRSTCSSMMEFGLEGLPTRVLRRPCIGCMGTWPLKELRSGGTSEVQAQTLVGSVSQATARAPSLLVLNARLNARTNAEPLGRLQTLITWQTRCNWIL